MPTSSAAGQFTLLKKWSMQGSDGRHWAVYPTTKAEALHADINKASGDVTRRIQQHIGKENFDETVARVRSVSSALK